MNDKIIHRLFQYLEYKDIPHTRFEKEVDMSNGYLNTQLKRSADLGETIIRKIVNNCLDINPLWLLTGEGEMLKAKIGESSVLTEIVYNVDPRDAEILAANKDTIETQKKLILSLEQRIKELEHCTSYSKDSAFPSAHSAASIGGVHQSKTTK